MLGLLRGIDRGVQREGAAQRDYYGTVLSSKENHLDRLLNQIRYNQQRKYQRDRDARADYVSDRSHQYRQDRAERQDFVTDRAYDRSIIESDRSHALRQNADRRAGEAHEFLYDPETGYQVMQRDYLGKQIEEWDLGAPNRALQRKHDAAIMAYDMGEGLNTRRQRDAMTREEYMEYLRDAPLRDLERRRLQKYTEYEIGEGFDEYREDRSLKQDLIRAQINNLNRPRSTSSSGPKPLSPTWAQTRDITVESLAPQIADHVMRYGDSGHWNPGIPFVGGPTFKKEHPWSSTNPNDLSQTKLLRQAGANLMRELTERGVDPLSAQRMVPDYFDQILESRGDLWSRLKRTSQTEGYTDAELRREIRDIVYQGAWNYTMFPEGDGDARPGGQQGSDADAILDRPLGIGNITR